MMFTIFVMVTMLRIRLMVFVSWHSVTARVRCLCLIWAWPSIRLVLQTRRAVHHCLTVNGLLRQRMDGQYNSCSSSISIMIQIRVMLRRCHFIHKMRRRILATTILKTGLHAGMIRRLSLLELPLRQNSKLL